MHSKVYRNNARLSFTYYSSGRRSPKRMMVLLDREVNTVAKKNKVQENYSTPNEKFNAEFAEENSVAGTQKSSQKVRENYSTPNEKFDAEFAEENSANNKKSSR